MINSTAIILAGGKSSRMNYENKALLEYNGKTFLDIAIEKVIRFDEILIITSKFNKYNYEGIRILEDIIPDQGPLGGIYTGLKNARNNISVVLPCDTPLLDAQLLEYFLEACNGYDGVVPKVDGHYQPVCAAYTKKCLDIFEKSLLNGIKKLPDLFEKLNLYYVSRGEIEKYGNYESMFSNINTKLDYKKIIDNERG